jgi:hypothetical protein
MLACRTVLGSPCYSCFAMRQRLIYFSFNKTKVNPTRVLSQAFVYFSVISVLALVPVAITTFVPSQFGKGYRFVGVYFQWVCVTVHHCLAGAVEPVHKGAIYATGGRIGPLRS